jgi:hypothetical protein
MTNTFLTSLPARHNSTFQSNFFFHTVGKYAKNKSMLTFSWCGFSHKNCLLKAFHIYSGFSLWIKTCADYIQMMLWSILQKNNMKHWNIERKKKMKVSNTFPHPAFSDIWLSLVFSVTAQHEPVNYKIASISCKNCSQRSIGFLVLTEGN